MAKPRAILKRAQAVKNIAKITKTMQMIATAKFKRAHDRAVAARPYTDRLQHIIGELSAAAGSFTHPLLERHGETKRVALIGVSSNRGLCGGYNTNVGRELVRLRRELEARGVEVEIHACGKKLGSMLRYQGVPVKALHTHFEDRPTFAEAEALVGPLMERFGTGDLDEIHVVYTKFLSAARQTAVNEMVLPLTPLAAAEEEEEDEAPSTPKAERDYIYAPDPETILSDILPRSVRLHAFQAFLDAAVSEQTARMIAMKSATDNAMDMIKNLTMAYNRSRQAQITTELSEIMGGAAALD